MKTSAQERWLVVVRLALLSRAHVRSATVPTMSAQHNAVYVRISADPLDTRVGVARQAADCTAMCARR